MVDSRNAPDMYDTVQRRLTNIETRLDTVEKEVIKQGLTDVEMETEFRAIRQDFNSLKGEVLLTVKDHTDKTWGLIEKSWKVIIILIFIIITFAGIKLGPEVVKILFN